MGPIQPAQLQKNLFSQMSEKNLERLRNESGFGKIDAEKDIEKAIWYLQRHLENLRNKSNE